MNDLVLPAVLAAVAVLVSVRPPASALGRLTPGVRLAIPEWVRRRFEPPADTTRLATELPDTLGFLAVCLDAGQPMAGAVHAVARISPPATADLLQGVAAQLALGRAGPQAWETLRAHPIWGPVAADIARAERSGTALTGVLRVHAEDIRQDSRDRALKAARTVGVRSVIPLMVCFLPAFMLIGVIPIIAGLLANFFS